MDHLTSEQTRALKALRADRIGFLLMGLILGGCMIGAASWGLWAQGFRRLWVIIAAVGYLFAHGGVSIWKDKTQQIRELLDPMMQEESPILEQPER